MDKNTNLALLESTLDIYGADRARWPAEIRARLAAFTEEHEAARKLIAQDIAFEETLSASRPADGLHLDMLADRIVARVKGGAETGNAGAGNANGDDQSNIIQWPGPNKSEAVPQAPQITQNAARQPGSMASAAALLAASLMVGVFAGSTDFMKPIALQVAESIGIVENVDPVVVALVDESPELTEWDLQ